MRAQQHLLGVGDQSQEEDLGVEIGFIGYS